MFDTKLMLKKGFTLIELLIVIAVLGILAVAVISAINPIEQINRSRDTGQQSDAEQLISAIDRYYANNEGSYPWKVSASNPVSDTQIWQKVDASWKVVGQGDARVGKPVLDILGPSYSNELKSSFITRIEDTGYNGLFVYNAGAPGNSTYVCFPTQSGSFNTEAWKRCGSTKDGTGLPIDLQGAKGNICLGDPASNKNYSCLP